MKEEITKIKENNYEKFIIRYTNRINNFRNYLKSGNFINFIINKFDNNTYELEKLIYQLYPNLKFRLHFIKAQSNTMYMQILKMMRFSDSEIDRIKMGIVNYDQDEIYEKEIENNEFKYKILNESNIMNKIYFTYCVKNCKIVPVKKKNDLFLDYYKTYFKTESHNSSNLNLFRNYSQKSNSILELSLSPYNLSVLWACLLGLKPNSKYEGIYSISLDDEIIMARNMAIEKGINFKICAEMKDPIIIDEINRYKNFNLNESNLKSYSKNLEQTIKISESFDTLIINSWFTYHHIKYNLDKFSQYTNKYIIICGTTKYEFEDHDLYSSEYLFKNDDPSKFDIFITNKKGIGLAISEFLENNKNWTIYEKHFHNYGVTVLKKHI